MEPRLVPLPRVRGEERTAPDLKLGDHDPRAKGRPPEGLLVVSRDKHGRRSSIRGEVDRVCDPRMEESLLVRASLQEPLGPKAPLVKAEGSARVDTSERIVRGNDRVRRA